MTAQQFDCQLAIYFEELVRYAQKLGERMFPEDLVQEAMIKALRYRGAFTGKSIRPLLYRITHNVFIDQCRKRKQDPKQVDISAKQFLSDEDIENKAIGNELNRTMVALDTEKRQACEIIINGGSVDHVADHLKIGSTAALNLVCSAWADLCEVFGHENACKFPYAERRRRQISRMRPSYKTLAIVA